jgi:hypothetical protein
MGEELPQALVCPPAIHERTHEHDLEPGFAGPSFGCASQPIDTAFESAEPALNEPDEMMQLG